MLVERRHPESEGNRPRKERQTEKIAEPRERRAEEHETAEKEGHDERPRRNARLKEGREIGKEEGYP